jgi:hypothetical protein
VSHCHEAESASGSDNRFGMLGGAGPAEQTDRPAVTTQDHPLAMPVQVALQAMVALASSQTSDPSTSPLPQLWQTLRDPAGPEHTKFGSMVHVGLQPSPLALFPSSQCSKT